ncbi:uncharacterized protein LOC135335133 [Halichondria panicea]|uniref:uncharacterized protein LOC135335133 n=1 Tax=Halichondria panicea TaxID=6063 RepID=UPI00312BA502
MYCLGCGSDIADKLKDSRNVNTSSSENVAAVWKAFLENEDQQAVADVDSILNGGDSQRVPKMCKNCFYSYNRYTKLHDKLQENIRKAADVLELQLPLPKKRKLDSSLSWQTTRAQPSGSSTQSPEVAIKVCYKTPKTFLLTPSRKHIGKAIARKSRKKVAMEALKDPTTRKYLLKMVGIELAKKVKCMSSESANSILQSQNPDDLRQFSWEMLLNELSKFAPVLRQLLDLATNTRVRRSNTDAVIGMCAAILINHRNPKMNLVQRSNALVLYAGHSSKQVIKTFPRQTKLAKASTSDDSDTDLDSDSSWKNYSPITSGSEDKGDDDLRSNSSSSDVSNFDSSDEEDTPNHPTMYHLVGDNVDKGIKQRYMRVGTSKPDDIHYFHSYAVGDRIDFMNLSDQVIPTLQQNSEQVAVSLLPTSDDDLALRNNMCILMSRILYENMGFFNLAFDGVVDWHIKHQFYDEMSTKSKVHPLGILPKDENKTEHMIDIMSDLQQYVPMVEMVKDFYIPTIARTVPVVTARAYLLQFAGDQKTAARARGAQKAKVNEVPPSGQLVGLVLPVATDWHTKMILLNVRC